MKKDVKCGGLLSARAHELRRYVRFRRRLPGSKEARRLVVSDVRKLLGRMHQDYLDYVSSNQEAPTCQLDSVIGKAEDAKAILAIAWPESNFQVGLLIDKGRPESARKAILKAMRAVAKACPGKPFPMEACLSDNGTEFHDYRKAEEAMAGGGIAVKTFYARPMRSDDKAEAQRNHELQVRLPQREKPRRPNPGGPRFRLLQHQLLRPAVEGRQNPFRAGQGQVRKGVLRGLPDKEG